jgi:two-component system, OmpR family, sensor kinase
MIRTRLKIAFALISVLALLQSAFAWWSARTAAEHAERNVIAAGMLAAYEAVGADKQRLKVWFAEAMLTGQAPADSRQVLLDRMSANLRALGRLARRDAELRGSDSPEQAVIDSLERNFAIFAAAVADVRPGIFVGSAAVRWRSVLTAFDEFAGRDMRVMLRGALERQQAASSDAASQLESALSRVRVANIALALLVLAAIGVSAWFFWHTLARPIAQLNDVAARFADGDLSARTHLAGRDEFGRLGRQLDSMAERLQEAKQRDLALNQSLDALVVQRTRAATRAHEALLKVEARRRQFFAEVSHELRTPVTVIRGEADIALRSDSNGDAPLRAALGRISEAAADLGRRVTDLLDAARATSAEFALVPQALEPLAVLRGTAEQLGAIAQLHGVALRVQPSTSTLPSIHADRDRLQQALTIVIDNALRYTPAGGAVALSVERDDDWVVFSVRDNGPGLSEAEFERVFEPHFRGAAGRSRGSGGAGLGLSIAQRILAAHGGAIELAPNLPTGLVVTLLLPLAAASEAAA